MGTLIGLLQVIARLSVKVGDLVKGKLWGELGIVVCVPPMPSMIEVCWIGEKPRRQKHLLGDLEALESEE